MSMGRMNNGLLTQDYMDELLNVGGADRQQYGTLMSPIVNPINQRVLGGLTEAKRARGGALDDYLSRYQQGIETLDEQAMPPFSFDELNQAQKDALMRGEKITLDDRRTTIGNIGGFSLTRPSRTYGIEDFGLELPPAGNVLSRQDRELAPLPGQEDMLSQAFESQGMGDVVGALPMEEDVIPTTTSTTMPLNEFDQEDADFGLTADIKPSEEKNKTRSFLSNISNIFDNKEAFGKIALGVALLEGTPINEAFAMYKEFGAGDDAEVELYDNQLGRVVDVGSYDNARFRELLRTGQGRYEINPIGTSFAAKSGREELIMAKNIERDSTNWTQNYANAAAKASSALLDARQLQEILDDPNFESGLLEKYKLPIRRIIADVTGEENPTVNQQLLFRTIISKLIPNVRPEGAGATSDFEIDLYARATAALENPEAVNKKLVEDMIAMNELTIKRAQYTDKALREGRSLVEADRDFSEAMDILYYDKEYSPDNLSQNQLGLLQEVYGGQIPIPKSRLIALKPYIENEVKRNSKADFVILTY